MGLIEVPKETFAPRPIERPAPASWMIHSTEALKESCLLRGIEESAAPRSWGTCRTEPRAEGARSRWVEGRAELRTWVTPWIEEKAAVRSWFLRWTEKRGRRARSRQALPAQRAGRWATAAERRQANRRGDGRAVGLFPAAKASCRG
jgi:hypothetical protein